MRSNPWSIIRISIEFARIDDSKIYALFKISLKLMLSRPYEHISHKESVIWPSTENSYFKSIIRIPSSITIDYIYTL